MRIFLTVIAAAFAAAGGGVLALVAGGLLTDTDPSPLARRLVAVPGGVAGLVAGGAHGALGRTASGHGPSVFGRVALVAVGAPFVRFGVEASHAPTGATFVAAGAILIALGVWKCALVAVEVPEVRDRAPAFAEALRRSAEHAGDAGPWLFGPLAFAVLLVAAYQGGGSDTVCVRHAGRTVDCHTTETAWFSRVPIRQETLEDVRRVRVEAGDTVLEGVSGSMRVLDSALRVFGGVEAFLNDERPMMRVRAPRREAGAVPFAILAALALCFVDHVPAREPAEPPRRRERFGRSRRVTFALGPLLLAGGVASCFVGLDALLRGTFEANAKAAARASTPHLETREDLHRFPRGTIVYAEGRIAERTELVRDELVAFHVEHRRRTGKRGSSWTIVDRVCPPTGLWIDLAGEGSFADRPLRLVPKRDCSLELSEVPAAKAPDRAGVRTRGLRRGDRVLVYGQVEEVDGERRLTPWLTHGGVGRDDLERWSRQGGERANRFGWGAVGLGVALIVASALRSRSRPGRSRES